MKKQGIVILRIEQNFKDHLQRVSKKNKKGLSEYVRDAAKKESKYKGA